VKERAMTNATKDLIAEMGSLAIWDDRRPHQRLHDAQHERPRLDDVDRRLSEVSVDWPAGRCADIRARAGPDAGADAGSRSHVREGRIRADMRRLPWQATGSELAASVMPAATAYRRLGR